MSDINIARDLLLKEAHSLVIVKNGEVLVTSNEKGLKPLIFALVEHKDIIRGAALADKIIGKAAALISLYGGIKEVYAHTLSDCAKVVFQKNNVKIESSRVVPYIINREGTDKCPMEKLVEKIEEPEVAYNAILEFIRNLKVDKGD